MADSPLPEISPDSAEEKKTDFDNIVPTQGYNHLPIVGLGGSAGSIQALERFFSAVPPKTGLAFVVIIHLAPNMESELPAILQRFTPMKVHAAIDGAKVVPDCVYIIPPGKLLSSVDGQLKLSDLETAKGRRVAIDLFFRTLADTHGAHSAAIVLSGADSDGTIGIKRIKERGGLTIAQDPIESEHSEMPRSSIATGMVDWILKVEEMPGRVVEYFSAAKRLRLPPEEGTRPVPGTAAAAPDDDGALRDLLIFLRTRTGRDFSCYKRATILRRISRRMQVNGTESLPDYLAFVRTHSGECAALLQDLFISVTNFFRDRDCFAALERKIPSFFANKNPERPVRVWVPACATGEEAYSVAILLIEHARKLERPPTLQVFASDLNEEALQVARDGIYPDSISADVSDDRLRLFFVREKGGYRIRREVREAVLFAPHDLLQDSPFSRLDLVSCRNLLIYLDRDAQRRALDVFHFALLPTGTLFLGSCESIEEAAHTFSVVDAQHRLFAPKPGARSAIPLPVGSNVLVRSLELRKAAREHPGLPAVVPLPQTERLVPSEHLVSGAAGELHGILLGQLGPPSILVNSDHEIVNLSAAASPFLKFSAGEPSRDLLRAVPASVRIPLRAALFRAQQSGEVTAALRTPIETGASVPTWNIRIIPVKEYAPGYLLVMFEAAQPDKEIPNLRETEPLLATLELELEQTKAHLRNVVEQGETSTEELKSSNEELQAVNEELRSATEELETSREELQSINEELTTVNQELKIKVEELGRANSDLHNLMAATSIPNIFLDRQLRVTRFTPAAVEIFNLIESDVGRPLGDITANVEHLSVMADAEKVLRTLERFQLEVVSKNGIWYLTTINPYRTLEDRVGGVVLTYVDITRQKESDKALREAAEQLLLAKADLERRVEERTAELDRTNAILHAEITERTRSEEARQEMTRCILSAQEDERARISRGLHDQVGQQLTALGLGLKALPPASTGDALRRSLMGIVENVAKELHELALDLRPTALDDLGLERTIANYLTEWSGRSGIAADFDASGLDGRPLPSTIETTLYRILCEALNNVLKHAGAKHVSVIATRRANAIVAIVEDNGTGFDPSPESAPAAGRKLGVAGMKERASLLGGQVTIETGPGRGTTVFVRLPLSG